MKHGPWIVTAVEEGVRLDKWLADAQRLGSRKRAFEALARGRIFLEEREQAKSDAGRPVHAGMVIRYWEDRPGSAARRPTGKIGGLDILYEDGGMIVLNKPAGLLTVPLAGRPEEPSLVERIEEHWRSHKRREPMAVHRLDRDTTGVVVFAHTPDAWQALKDCFRRREPLRRYDAVVLGRLRPQTGTWRSWVRWDESRRMQIPCEEGTPDAREALTRYEVVEEYAETSLLRLELETGRQHQVRVQAMAAGHPLLGERIYAGKGGVGLSDRFSRQALHASCLAFPHPTQGRPCRFEAPPPGDLRQLVHSLRG